MLPMSLDCNYSPKYHPPAPMARYILMNGCKWVIVSETTYVLSMMVLKISLGIFFARIVIQSWHLVLIYVTVGINILSSLAAFFYCIFRCGANLDDYVLQQLRMKCTSKKLDLFMAYQSGESVPDGLSLAKAHIMNQASFNTLTDLVFLLLPMSILWSSTMDHRSKFSVGFILCIATLSVAATPLKRYNPQANIQQGLHLFHGPIPLCFRPHGSGRLFLECRQHFLVVHHRSRRQHHGRLSRHPASLAQAHLRSLWRKQPLLRLHQADITIPALRLNGKSEFTCKRCGAP